MPQFPKIALVTGAAQRIGRTIAIDLAAHGWAVAVHYGTSAEEAARVVSEIEDGGGRAAAFQADLQDEESAIELVQKATAALGPLTCLVNNASAFEYDKLESVSRQSWDLHMQVNLRTPFVLTQAFVPQVPISTQGNVINILDQRVWNLTPHFTSYTVSKVALWTLTQTLAMALAPRVRVNAVGPGPTLRSTRQSEKQFAQQWASLPLEKQVMPQEIADAIRFILDAPSMTGQMIAVDGGQHLGLHRGSSEVVVEE